MADTAPEATSTTTTDAPVDEPTITLPDQAPAPAAPEAPTEPTAEEKVAEEARRAALTDEERTAEDTAKAEAEAKAKEEAAAKAPEKYEAFKLPDDVQSVAETLEEFTGLAKKHNLSQDAAQEFVDMGAKLNQRFVQQQQEVMAQAKAEWTKQSMADKEFGGEKAKENIGVAETAIKAWTTPEFRKLLKDSGLSQHPEMIRTFFRVGKAMQPDKTIPANQAGAVRDESDEARANRLYGTTAKAA